MKRIERYTMDVLLQDDFVVLIYKPFFNASDYYNVNFHSILQSRKTIMEIPFYFIKLKKCIASILIFHTKNASYILILTVSLHRFKCILPNMKIKKEFENFHETKF